MYFAQLTLPARGVTIGCEMLSKPITGEWIVEARLPSRQVAFARAGSARHSSPVAITSEKPGVRESSLRELFAYLDSVLKVKPILLNAAGAISITAGPEELDLISNHPLVKRIEPNRRHRLSG